MSLTSTQDLPAQPSGKPAKWSFKRLFQSKQVVAQVERIFGKMFHNHFDLILFIMAIGLLINELNGGKTSLGLIFLTFGFLLGSLWERLIECSEKESLEEEKPETPKAQ